MPDDDTRLAVALAELAGGRLLSVRAELEAAGTASRVTKDTGDAAAQAVLAAQLAEWCPADAVLSEEAADDSRRVNADRVWIIDPLDGTREFSEFDRDDWAVHVALWQNGDLTAGAVALPARGVTFSTETPFRLPPDAVRYDNEPVNVRDGSLPKRTANSAAVSADRIRMAVSRSRPPAMVTALADVLDVDLVPMGSAGVKAMSVVAGETDAYVHAGGQFEWDSAAPVAVARAAGLHTSRVDGSPLRYNNENPWLPDLLICRTALAPGLLTEIAQL